MPSPWRAMQERLDALVDDTWAEPVVLYPWTGGDATREGHLDSARAVVATEGIYVRPGAGITGEGGTQGAGLNTQILQSDVWLSIVANVIGDSAIIGSGKFKQNDRVYFNERNEWLTINYIEPSATNRPNIHLIRLSPNSVIVPLFNGTPLTTNRPSIGKPVLLSGFGLVNSGLRSTLRSAQRLEDEATRMKGSAIMSGKLSELAQRINQTRKNLEAEADRLSARLDQIDQTSPEVFSRAHGIIQQSQSDLNDMEEGLRALSNLPLDDLPAASPPSPRPVSAVNDVGRDRQPTVAAVYKR